MSVVIQGKIWKAGLGICLLSYDWLEIRVLELHASCQSVLSVDDLFMLCTKCNHQVFFNGTATIYCHNQHPDEGRYI